MAEEEHTVPEGAVPVVRSSEFRSIYINHAVGGLTSWDLHFVLSTLIAQSADKPRVEEQVDVIMTCEFAKALVNTIQQGISQYEERFARPREQPKQE